MGDPVCWLNKVCPECGAFNEDPGRPCWRCGVELPAEDVIRGQVRLTRAR